MEIEKNDVINIETYKTSNLIINENYKNIKIVELFLKRLIDIIGAVIGISLLIPITIAVLIFKYILKEEGPIFYSHIRIGKNGKPFKMYKFRTMCVNADEKLQEILKNDKKIKKEWEENRKIKKDPRITPLGKYLRKNSIDEFPQFINVLIGNMSLVGPRPVVSDEVKMYGEFKNTILSVKPGITGLWATHGRSEIGYNERILLESSYANNFSLWLDIKIIIKTIVLVLKKDGAY